MKSKIVLLGTGYTSVWAYRYLLKNLSKKEQENLDIEVISATPYHAFHGFTGEYLSGFLPIKLRHTPQKDLFPNAKFTHGFVLKIDQNQQKVQYLDIKSQTTQELDYQHLVVGMGSKDNRETIQGIAEHTFSVKDNKGLENTRKRIIEVIQEANTNLMLGRETKPLSFAVCGAGLAGVELCGNLCEYIEKLKMHYPILIQNGYQVHLIHSGEEILPQLSNFKGLVRYCNRELENYGVKMHLKSRVKEFNSEGILLENEEMIAAQVVISTLGQTVCAPDACLPFQKDETGRILGDTYLKAKGFENIWIGGDVANIPHISGKYSCRADALWAIKHGTWIGRNIARTLKEQPLKRFTFFGLGQAASLGKNKAFTELYGIQIKGILAWWVRFGFFLYFTPKRAMAFETLKAWWKSDSWLFPSKDTGIEKETLQNESAFLVLE